MKKQTKQTKNALTALVILSPLLTVSIAGYYYSTGVERNTLRAIVAGEEQAATFGQTIQMRPTAKSQGQVKEYAGHLHLKIPTSRLMQGNEEKKSITRTLVEALRDAGIQATLGWSKKASWDTVDVYAGPKTLSCLDDLHERTKEGSTRWMRAIEENRWSRETCADEPEDRQWWIRLIVSYEIGRLDLLIMFGLIISISASIWTTATTTERLYREYRERRRRSRQGDG